MNAPHDHRRLGRELGLFDTDPLMGAGLPYWLPDGAVVRAVLEEYVTEVNTLMFLMAPVTAVWGALMFGEPFGVQTAVGLGAGLAAVVVVHRGGRSGAARQGFSPHSPV